LRKVCSALVVFGVLALLPLAGSATAANSDVKLSGNTPGFTRHAVDKGEVSPASTVTVTVWLRLHNEQQLDNLVRDQRTDGSANYHKWLTQGQFDASFDPTAQEANAVSNYLAAKGLTVTYVAENRFYVKVQGTAAAIEKAFKVSLHNFSYNGQTYRANTDDPTVANGNIAAITGLDDFGFQPAIASQPDGTSYRPLSLVNRPGGLFFEGQCDRAPETHTFTKPGVSATYTGRRFGADITNTSPPDLPPCGYAPAEIRTAYNINPLYAAGLRGEGQTIVITDAYGSQTIRQDVDLFDQVYGLPPIDLTIPRAPGIANNPKGVQRTWDAETTLDVEWAHAIAPAAKIVLVTATDHSSLDEAINYAVIHHLGNTISNSWGTFEGAANPAAFGRDNRILEQAAAEGIDVNFATGDFGDYTTTLGFKTVSFPASSPLATAIGGTSLMLNPDNTIKWQIGWGTNETRIADTLALGSPPQDPPLHLGFVFGAGGGTSSIFPRPSWQTGVPASLPATRAIPDVSMDGDPFTGVEIIQTIDGTPSVGVIGGTSLATPVFSAVMALAAQKAGHGLGQVAPLLYPLQGTSSITDVRPPSAALLAENVSGSITDSSGTKSYGAADLAQPLGVPANDFLSGLYNSPFTTRWFALTFGTDTSLQTRTGWDEITGVGTPNSAALVSAIGH
jgi:subtilase family serine protease